MWEFSLFLHCSPKDILLKLMLHALYMVAFAVLATLAVSNLIRNLVVLGSNAGNSRGNGSSPTNRTGRSLPHPEMLDDSGHIVDEPLLVMKSISLEDAREQLDALYNKTPYESGSDAEADA